MSTQHHNLHSTETLALPEDVAGFYDPNATFHSQSHLIDALLRRPAAYGLKKWDLVLAELQSVGTDSHTLQEVAAQANMTESAVSRTDELVRLHADALAKEVLARIAKLNNPIRGGLDRDVVLASAIVSANSHRHDKPRLSGGPYYNHPKAVAKIISIAWHHHADTSNELDLQLKQSLGLLHDAWENMFAKKPRSFMHDEERILITPFSYAHLLGRLGVSEATAHDAMVDLRRVTKQPDVVGTGQDYENYIYRSPWQENAATAKIADIHHNFELDRKPTIFDQKKSGRNSAKRIQYREAPFHIRHSLNTGKRDVSLMLGYIGYIKNDDLTRMYDPVLDAFTNKELEI